MSEPNTTVAIQGYLDNLAAVQGETAAEPAIRALLERAVDRLHLLCASMLHRSYPRLLRPPVNLQPTEMLSAVVERMLKALREARPGNVRQFFAIASQHMRWELNDVARRLDEEGRRAELLDNAAAAPAESDSGLGPSAVRILEAIESLPDEEREVFDLIRIQGMSQPEAAGILGISVRTVQRRLSSSLLLLSETLDDLRPTGPTDEDGATSP